MPGNTFGYLFRVTTFGESHGPAVGGIVDGCPAGLGLDFEFIRQELERRHPDYPGSTPRKETDQVEWLSGLKGPVTTGTPIAFLIRNLSKVPGDYDPVAGYFRPSHADYTYEMKYGIREERGGGRASGRETVARVVAGAIAKLLLKQHKIDIEGFITRIGPLQTGKYAELGHFRRSSSLLSLADPGKESEALDLLRDTASKGDSLGGTIACRIRGAPAGLGEPVFDKLQADLARALLSIGTARSFELGLGAEAGAMFGSSYNDIMESDGTGIKFLSNHDGGIQGGISNGEEICFQVGFKPVPSIHLPQQMVNMHGETREITLGGRHDACHVPRVVVVVEAMAALVLADHLLRNLSARMDSSARS